MSTFDDRENAFEKQYARDGETQFRITARRNKLLGLWAAQKLGLSGDKAEAYAKETVMADFQEQGHDDVVRKLIGDFKAAGVSASEQEVRREMERLLAVAREQIASQA